jgi:hypothetical protein
MTGRQCWNSLAHTSSLCLTDHTRARSVRCRLVKRRVAAFPVMRDVTGETGKNSMVEQGAGSMSAVASFDRTMYQELRIHS